MGALGAKLIIKVGRKPKKYYNAKRLTYSTKYVTISHRLAVLVPKCGIVKGQFVHKPFSEPKQVEKMTYRVYMTRKSSALAQHHAQENRDRAEKNLSPKPAPRNGRHYSHDLASILDNWVTFGHTLETLPSLSTFDRTLSSRCLNSPLVSVFVFVLFVFVLAECALSPPQLLCCVLYVGRVHNSHAKTPKTPHRSPKTSIGHGKR